MKKQLLVLFLLSLVAISACAPDPRKEAQAYAIKSEADQQALNQEQTRKQVEELHNLNVEREEELYDLEVEREQLDIQKDRATAAVWNKIADTFLTSIAAMFLILLTSVVYEVTRANRGISDAITIAALNRANLIPLNPTTRQFPLLIKQVSTYRFAVYNPNDGSVTLLDERNPADRQKIAAASLTQVSGVLASEARQSSDPAGMSMIRPPVLDVKSNGDEIMIGDSFIRNAISLNTGE